MAKLNTANFSFDGIVKDELKFKTDIYVLKEGSFTTTIPNEISELIKNSGIRLSHNQLGNLGYFIDNTYNGLINQISIVCKEYLSKELIEEKIIIKYSIQTTCSYCLDIDGKVVPNGKEEWVRNNGKYEWKEGTVQQNATNSNPFGIQIYAKPFVKKVYKFKSGKEKTDYIQMCYSNGREKELEYFGKFLEGFSSICPPKDKIQEIEYTEGGAKFFVEMLISICLINEKIKDFINPQSIKLLIENKQKLLG